MSKKATRSHRHPFRFKLANGNVATAWAKVIPARKAVALPLKAEHVRESIRRRGIGDTQNCSMAVCAHRESGVFPHRVEGFIDWFYSRAFVVSKLDRNGLPVECYEYVHNDNIAKLNDTKGGQGKLLAELEAKGDRVINLLPVRAYASRAGGKPNPKKQGDGSRTKVHRLQGGNARFAHAFGSGALASPR